MYDGNCAAATRVTCYVLEGVASLALINAKLGECFSQSLATVCSRFHLYNVYVVDAALVVSGYKAGSMSNYWTNCTLTIATGSAPSCDRTNSKQCSNLTGVVVITICKQKSMLNTEQINGCHRTRLSRSLFR